MPKKGQTKANATKRSKQQRKYNSQPQQKKNRAARNTARRRAMKAGKVRKGDGKDVNHKKPLRSGGTNAKKNLNVQSKKTNRANNGKTGGRKPTKRARKK